MKNGIITYYTATISLIIVFLLFSYFFNRIYIVFLLLDIVFFLFIVLLLFINILD